MLKNCSSCGVQTRQYAEFPAPDTGEMIVRCTHCRKISNPYRTPAGLIGP
ncbi:Uncharacterised protein [uncultured archaeon]|nr:Uncharacterised protein [uncultured archaeon]